MYVNFYQACVFIERDNIEFLIVPLNYFKELVRRNHDKGLDTFKISLRGVF